MCLPPVLALLPIFGHVRFGGYGTERLRTVTVLP